MTLRWSMLTTLARITLGATFSSAALNYFWTVLCGRSLFPVSITSQAREWSGEIIQIGYLWPLMKGINLTAGLLLIANRAPAFAVALLLPVTVIIIWFQIFLNPLPGPIATTVLIVTCELILLRAYARHYANLFTSDRMNAMEPMREG